MSNFFLYLNAIDGQTGAPKLFDPEWVTTDGITWSYQQQGGLASINVSLAAPFEFTGLAGGDYLEVWASGESTPRARGIITITESEADLKETYKLTAMGRMVHMSRTVIYQVFFDPAGANQDISLLAAKLFSGYQKRIAQATGYLPPLVSLIKSVGLSMESLSMDPATARSGFDTLFNQTASNVVWGWDIDPVTGYDRFYFLPRSTAVNHEFAVGADVKLLNLPSETDQLVNACLLRGGGALYPNLVTNASYEQPTNPTSDSGGILLNGGFEEPQAPTDSNPGFTNNRSDWTFSSSATANWHDPITNHNFSPHTGQYCLLLDGQVSIPNSTDPLDGSNSLYGSGDWAYQDVVYTIPYPNTPVIATLYAAQEGDGTSASGILFLIGLDSSKIPTGEYTCLPIDPQSIAWTGGAPGSLIGAQSLIVSKQFTDSSTAYLRVYLASTSTAGATHGLLIDDCTLAPRGAVGQYGWGTHVQNPGNPANSVTALWACEAAAWDGAYGVRATVIADSGDRPVINPAGSTAFNGGSGGPYGFKPGAGQSLLVAVRVRMTQGAVENAGLSAGGCNLCYREFAGDGHETQSVFEPSGSSYSPNIPNDGLWHCLWVQASAHGDATSAYAQIEFTVSGVYDIDGWTVRDAACSEYALLPTSGGTTNQQTPFAADYLRGAQFERYVTAESVCISGNAADNAAAASVGVWGRLEAIVDNSQIIEWTADAVQTMQQYFQRAAVPLQRPSLTLIDRTAAADIVLPSDGGTVAITGVQTAITPQWCSKATYTWAKGALRTQLDLNNERPTLAKLLLLSAQANSGGSSASTPSVGAPGGGGQVGTPGGTGAPPPSLQVDSFTGDGSTSVFALTQPTQNSAAPVVFVGGIIQPAVVSGATYWSYDSTTNEVTFASVPPSPAPIFALYLTVPSISNT